MITTDINTIIGQIRIEIGDDSEIGVRPDGTHLDDDTLLYLYEAEGGDSSATPIQTYIGRAAARACEILARDWAKAPSSQRLGPGAESYEKASERYAAHARELRGRYGAPVLTTNETFAVPGGTAEVTAVPYYQE